MRLEMRIISGGWYARKKVQNWENVVQEGKLPTISGEPVRGSADNINESRPSVEFYRSRDELLAMMPVRGTSAFEG